MAISMTQAVLKRQDELDLSVPLESRTTNCQAVYNRWNPREDSWTQRAWSGRPIDQR